MSIATSIATNSCVKILISIYCPTCIPIFLSDQTYVKTIHLINVKHGKSDTNTYWCVLKLSKY